MMNKVNEIRVKNDLKKKEKEKSTILRRNILAKSFDQISWFFDKAKF
jgi:hypothetical protein